MKVLFVFALAIATATCRTLDYIPKVGVPEGRIINGKPAEKDEAPFMVSLNRGSYYCAGSIIDKHWVLTVAQCLLHDSIDVIAGLYKLDDKSDIQIRNVPSKAYQIVHEDYDGNPGSSDIGLIYIDEPFDLNALARNGTARVAKINLPSGKYELTGKGRVYGWGIDNSGGFSNILQALDTNIIDYEECKAAMPDPSIIKDFNICTHIADTTDGPCIGDGGSPLIRNTPDGVELVGMVSFNYNPCHLSTYPSFYVMPSAFKDWIKNTIKNFIPENVVTE